jgi:ketosteroid isomerase-like protein
MSKEGAVCVLRRACELWAAGDLPELLSHFRDDLVFWVHADPPEVSLVGKGMSKALFAERLQGLLDQFAVQEFKLRSIWHDGLWHHTSVAYRYRHHLSGHEIDDTMHHKWGFVGDKIAHFELFYDAAKMRAFLGMAAVAAGVA